MDDSSTVGDIGSSKTPGFGQSAFGAEQQASFGHNIRLAMACIEGQEPPSKEKALPPDLESIRHRLQVLSREITAQHADLLELLVRFDELDGWKPSGARHCVAWMNLEIGIGPSLAWEYLRVGRKLRELPTLQALFRVGKLSWSKVRLISRVADADSEGVLCHAALDASVSDIKRLCDGYRWQADEDAETENQRLLQQWNNRSLTWHDADNGCTRIQLTLPPETAQAFLNCVEYFLGQMEDREEVVATDAETSMPQRRADAAVQMAEAGLQSDGSDVAAADRYQVIVSVDAAELSAAQPVEPEEPEESAVNLPMIPTTPAKRAHVQSAGPIARETARRIACDCSLSAITSSSGEPIDIGRKSRIWPHAMARAIRQRDQHCIWPGCTQTRHLHIHHIHHWADGGKTCVENGACLCSYHHTLVHEGGYAVQRVEEDSVQARQQFLQQQREDDVGQFEFETALRQNSESFELLRALMPERYRFRILDAHGRAIGERSMPKDNSQIIDTQDVDSQEGNSRISDSQISDAPVCNSQINDTPVVNTQVVDAHLRDTQVDNTQLDITQVCEPPARYRFTRRPHVSSALHPTRVEHDNPSRIPRDRGASSGAYSTRARVLGPAVNPAWCHVPDKIPPDSMHTNTAFAQH